ncbi:DUF397 domain-containing protein [Streptomyces sp. NPDC002067]
MEWSPTSARATDTVPVRDSKLPTSAVLTTTTRAWATLISAIKAGQLEAS